MSSASVQWVFCRSSSTCRCISDVSVGRKVISASDCSAILPRPPCISVFKINFSISINKFSRLYIEISLTL